MKKLLLACAILPSFSNAAEILTSDMYCDSTKTIVSQLKETYNEEPFLFGEATDGAKSIMSFWMNPLTKTWSILATKGDLSCIVGVGGELKIVPAKKKINI